MSNLLSISISEITFYDGFIAQQAGKNHNKMGTVLPKKYKYKDNLLI